MDQMLKAPLGAAHSTAAEGTVDVVIPLYNAERFIEQALRSVVEQTMLPGTIHVVDDGSTDGSLAVVRSFAAQYQGPVRIDLIEQKNAGPNSARNKGLQLSQADLIAFLDADDLWGPQKLAKQVEVFQTDESKDLVLVYCLAHWVDTHGSHCAGPSLNSTLPLRGWVFEQLLPRNRISGGSSAVLIRREAFRKAGSFDENLRAAEDFDMWLRLAQVGRVDLVEADLVAIRDHGTNTSKRGLYMLEGLIAFYAKWFDHGKKDPVAMHEWGHLIAMFVLRSSDRKAAIALVRSKLSGVQRQHLFRRTFGSIRLYVLLKRLRAALPLAMRETPIPRT